MSKIDSSSLSNLVNAWTPDPAAVSSSSHYTNSVYECEKLCMNNAERTQGISFFDYTRDIDLYAVVSKVFDLGMTDDLPRTRLD